LVDFYRAFKHVNFVDAGRKAMSMEQNPSLKTISLRILHLLVDSTYVGIYHLISQLIFLDDPKVFVL